MRSPFSLAEPPPDQPPAGVLCPSLWPVQIRWWLKHTPKVGGQSGDPCRICAQTWPCPGWACWDGQLGEALAAAKKYSQTEAPA